MIYNLDSPIDRSKASKRFADLLDDKCIIELKKKAKRSLNQNNYLHLILSYFGMETGYTLNESKQIYKDFNQDIYCYHKEPAKMKDVLLTVNVFYRSSADLDTVEMTKSIEIFRNYSAKEAGIYLPAPDEERFLQEIEVKASQTEYL